LNEKVTVTKRLERPVYRKKTRYYSYPSVEEEVEGIARGVKKLILEGVNPWEITVCFPILSKYLPMLRRVFRKYGIPVSIGEYNLSTTQAIVTLEEMITCVEEDYPRSDFLSLLTSPYFPSIPDVVKERSVAYSYRAGIVKGKESWLSIKEILLNSPKDNISDDEKERLREFQKEIKSIIEIIEGLKQKKDVFSFIDTFESVLNEFGFFDSLEAAAPSLGEELSDKITSQFSELRHFAGIYESGLHNFDTPGFYLRYLLQDLKGSDERKDGVKIIPFELAAGIETGELFFGGILEGEFPSRPEIDPILPEQVKKALGMPYLEYYLKRQKLYFKRLLNATVHDPYFSCPSADGDKVFLPSPFLDWGETVNPPTLNMFSEEDVLVREGSIRQSGMESKIFRGVNVTRSSGEMFHDRNSLGVLRQRIGAMFKGFFSVTDIDYYRKCPLRFYIEKVLDLAMETPPKFEVESRLWGSLAHKTMEYLYKDGDINLDELDEKIFQGLEKSLKHFPIGDFWSRVAKEIFRKLLPAIKEQENNIRMQGLGPYLVEKNMKAEINGLRLRGKIDRVDIRKQKSEVGVRNPQPVTRNSQPATRNSQSATRNTVILLDYKTGAVDNDSLQLPLYAGIWQENSSEPVEKLGYYSLKEGRVSWYPKKVEMEEFINNALKYAEDAVNRMKKGMFPPDPFKAGECRYCHHSPLCNKESFSR
jgi:ATP-dependent helicase/nuclease subunit B